jgi:hypothetical protein
MNLESSLPDDLMAERRSRIPCERSCPSLSGMSYSIPSRSIRFPSLTISGAPHEDGSGFLPNRRPRSSADFRSPSRTATIPVSQISRRGVRMSSRAPGRPIEASAQRVHRFHARAQALPWTRAGARNRSTESPPVIDWIADRTACVTPCPSADEPAA